MKTLLHVGCGFCSLINLPAMFQDSTWEELRYDIDPDVKPDIVGTLQDMSWIEDASIDALYSSHNIEHVWAFEVQTVLKEFRRVLKPDGFAVILCPDMLSVAQAIVDGNLEENLYISAAGPITAMDIVYGLQTDIERGNHFMAHKTAFTSTTLATHFERAGFAGAAIARDKVLGLQAVAFAVPWPTQSAQELAAKLQSVQEALIEVSLYGDFGV